MITFELIKSIFKNNGKVVENYFFMTALQILSSAFGILIYPYLIRVLGSESYGSYVFALAIISYFIGFVSFGFHYPALKSISQNINNKTLKSNTFSAIITAKSLLAIVAVVIFMSLLFSVPYMKVNKLLFSVVFVQVVSEIFNSAWYYQSVQKMAIVTYFQLFFRIASLPFIFIFVKSSEDTIIYSLIATLSILLPAIGLNMYLIYMEKIKIHIIKPSQLKSYFSDALPFFWTSATSTLKLESVTVIIGTFFGMHDVALYDLANKIIVIPRMLTQSINAAIFPKIINNTKSEVVKKIVRTETYLGIIIVILIAIFGYWLTLFLGGQTMTEAYPLAIILSFTIIAWLVVGSYINFVFIPQKKYYFVTQNQLIALFSFIAIAVPATILTKNISALIISLSLSGFFEIAYCKYLIAKHKML